MVAALVAAPSPAAAQDELSDARALQLMAACKAALGGKALDAPAAFHEIGTMARDGKVGAYETFGDLRALRSAASQTFDGVTRRAGFDGKRAWRVGADGQVASADDLATLRSERLGTYLTNSGYLYPDRFAARFQYLGRRREGGRAYDVVRVTPADAEGGQLWLDARTHRPAHFESSNGGPGVFGDLGEWREIAGTWVAFRLDVVEPDHWTSLRLTSFTYVPLDEAEVTAPPR